MYERMLDKKEVPSEVQIKEWIGEEAFFRLCRFEKSLKEQYELSKELRFPFGNQYGWGYKYSHKSNHLFYAFFEKDAFTVMIQIGDRQVPVLEKRLQDLSPKARELWAGRYPCGDNGGWVRCRVTEEADLADAHIFINVKKAPIQLRGLSGC